ncbi:probable E3 ubiquitin-protein ligase MID2 isoform X1 [Octopus bimaculoides]|uniref:RING-type domain-containing protein n=2 Tax=Octopus bimaculoides TaxID=37653 RepID=A0A0L8HNV6_OCTBM|nr:probable E3 ubiquitin-protein ligase MID2 isoform X1 [Octopus bimaculoides]|eukprot:XP_014770719.1 PREDICTED: probable E3 ubiquitin-protein ligase MID2 isoform X1 [Octopus bimaculoides]
MTSPSSVDVGSLKPGYVQTFHSVAPSPKIDSLKWFNKKRYLFSCTVMEEELSCPVCLELFADPLLLPCSHSICKKCLQDLVASDGEIGREETRCPTCRNPLLLSENNIDTLPRNLALENIVIRFQEICSNSLMKSKSHNLSSKSQFLLNKDLNVPGISEESKEFCELCEGKFCAKAEWFCQQCTVLYCQDCLDKFHPRRGSLSHHRICKALKSTIENKPIFCGDHKSEMTSVFCDSCKTLACPLCVCDGIGKHAGHMILTKDVASEQIKEFVQKTKGHLDKILREILAQTSKLEETKDEIKHLHDEASKRVSEQYQHILNDIIAVLSQQKGAHLNNLNEIKSKAIASLELHLNNSTKRTRSIDEMVEGCKRIANEQSQRELLEQASDIFTLQAQEMELTNELKQMESFYQELIIEKSAQQCLRSVVTRFRKTTFDDLKIFLDDDKSKCDHIVPMMQASPTPSKLSGVRVQNKCLMTWGFNSTTFTAEALNGNAFWSVNLECNSSHTGDLVSNYVFGVGIASERLCYKDQVGFHEKSIGIICSSGSFQFCKNGASEFLMALQKPPLTITIFVRFDYENLIVFGYKLANSSWDNILSGKKLIKDLSTAENLYPVFTVSQKVKMTFSRNV